MKPTYFIPHPVLDTNGNPLVVGAMYSCITRMESHDDYGALVRYCGKDKSGKDKFADADTWEEFFVECDELCAQLGNPVDPTTQGWPALC